MQACHRQQKSIYRKTVARPLIRFVDNSRKHSHGIQVAICETDPIVVTPDGKVAMHDHVDPEKRITCATDSERFLDGLQMFLKIRREKSKWVGREKQAAKLCAAKAGGRECETFFRLLCGFLAR
jgi:hypothetical protein